MSAEKICHGRPRCRWEDNIKMDLKEIGCEDLDWIEQKQDRDQWQALVNMVMNLWIPWKAGNSLTSWESISFLWKTLLHGISK